MSSSQQQPGASRHHRLTIGTAQFGLRYGVANQSGQVTPAEAASILREARGAGMDSLDTAIAYGVSEQTLGEIGVADWRITTKLPPLPDTVENVADWVSRSIGESLGRLGVPRVDGLLLHRPADLAGKHANALATSLRAAVDAGRVARLGISIYQPGELDQLWGRLPFGIVQAPFNVFDRRLESSGWLARLADAGVEVHTRSAFLQGLLIMAPESRPSWTVRWASVFADWQRWITESGLPAVSACLSFVLARRQITRVVVGVDSIGQLRELIASSSAPSMLTPPESLVVNDTELIDPSRWPRT